MKKAGLIFFLLCSISIHAQYTWKVVLPDLIGNVQYDYTSLTTIGQKCFLVGNTFNRDASTYQQFFMRSEDGGETWDSVRFGPSKFFLPFLKKIFARDSMHIYATGDSGYFTKSVDGGRTWSPLRRVWGIDKYTDLYFPDSLHGIIVGGSGVILTTFDGGENWKFNRTHRGWILYECIGFQGGKYLAFDTYGGRIFRSNDFGNSWDTIFAYDPYVGDDFQLFLNNIYFKDSLDGYICGVRMLENNTRPCPWIIHTSDGGEKWETIVDTSTKNVYDLFSMCFLSPEKGFAAGRHAKYLITNDSGKTWTTDSIDLSVTDWSSIDNVVKVSDKKVLAIAGNAVSNYLVSGSLKQAGVFLLNEKLNPLFPNPVMSKLLFSLDISIKKPISIYDFLGRKIREVSVSEVEKEEIDCSELPPGLYWLFNNTEAYKFIKQ
jgi:photosystem II stability/assembly factor-like uncharacterized protein